MRVGLRRSKTILFLVFCLLILASAQTSAHLGGYTRLATGDYVEGAIEGSSAIVSSNDKEATVWESEKLYLLAGPTDTASGEWYIYCVDIDSSEYDCDQGELTDDQSFHFEVASGYIDGGRHDIFVRIHEDGPGYDNPLIEEVSFQLRVIGKQDDEDNDGLTNEREAGLDTSLWEADSDSDGLDDGEELNEYSTDPVISDTDGDGLEDGDEVNQYSTDPLESDTDSDGLNDGDEVNRYDTDPNSEDSDGDGLNDGDEISRYGTEPNSADTDGDGLDDGTEVNQHDTNPTKSDTDGDGLNDGNEVKEHNTDPRSADTDGDGLNDGEEVNRFDTSPTTKDTDADGLDDGEEINEYSTSPNDAHTDGDGLDDGTEVNEYGTDPTNVDTDGDGINDGTEVERGTDPTDPESPKDDTPTEQAENNVAQSTATDASSTNNEGATDSAATEQQTPVNNDASQESKEDDFQRGFFINNPESGSILGILEAPQITALGLFLSLFGILLELLRGG